MVAVQAQKLIRKGVGASDISAVVGMNPFASPWDVYLRLVDDAPEKEQTEPMEWGHRLEPAIRQKYCDDTGAQIYVPPTSIFAADREWARATPDGIVLESGKWKHLLQCKNVGAWVAKSWEHEPPAYVQLQTQWEMYVTEMDRDDIAVLIGGNDFHVYTIHRDQKVIDDLLTIADAFWKKVQARTPPAVDDSDACREHFERKIKKTTIEVAADADTEALFAEWRSLCIRQKRDKKRVEAIRNVIRQQLAEAQATAITSSLGAAKLTFHEAPAPSKVTNWKHVAELLGSTKCKPEEFAEIVVGATSTLTPEPKAPTLYAPRSWAKEQE